MDDQLLATHLLADGVRVELRDVTRHYFGGYYHVRLQVQAEVPVEKRWFAEAVTHEDARRRLGSSVRYQRVLEKMAVPEAEVAHVRENLLKIFEKNVLTYLSRQDFPRRFVLSEYSKTLASPRAVRAYRHA